MYIHVLSLVYSAVGVFISCCVFTVHYNIISLPQYNVDHDAS